MCRAGGEHRLEVAAVAIERLRARAAVHALEQNWIEAADLHARVLQ